MKRLILPLLFFGFILGACKDDAEPDPSPEPSCSLVAWSETLRDYSFQCTLDDNDRIQSISGTPSADMTYTGDGKLESVAFGDSVYSLVYGDSRWPDSVIVQKSGIHIGTVYYTIANDLVQRIDVKTVQGLLIQQMNMTYAGEDLTSHSIALYNFNTMQMETVVQYTNIVNEAGWNPWREEPVLAMLYYEDPATYVNGFVKSMTVSNISGSYSATTDYTFNDLGYMTAYTFYLEGQKVSEGNATYDCTE